MFNIIYFVLFKKTIYRNKLIFLKNNLVCLIKLYRWSCLLEYHLNILTIISLSSRYDFLLQNTQKGKKNACVEVSNDYDRLLQKKIIMIDKIVFLLVINFHK